MCASRHLIFNFGVALHESPMGLRNLAIMCTKHFVYYAPTRVCMCICAFCVQRSRLAVHDTPKNIECKRHCCLKDPQTVLSPYTLKSTHRLLASTSSPQINAAYGIISPGQKAGANLVGDFSRAHSLPALPFSDGSNNGIARISWETLAATMRGEHSLPGKLIIIDCRYPYEFNAGHIQVRVCTCEFACCLLIHRFFGVHHVYGEPGTFPYGIPREASGIFATDMLLQAKT